MFAQVNVKVEPVFIDISNETQNNEKNSKKVKREKIPSNEVERMQKKIDLQKTWLELHSPVHPYNAYNRNPTLDLYKTITDESGKEVKIKVEETKEERRRRLARIRKERWKNKLSETQLQMEKRKRRIDLQKRRLKERLVETEEEAEERRRKYREQKRKSKQKIQNLTENVKNKDSNRCLSTTSDGEVHDKTPAVEEKRLAQKQLKIHTKNKHSKTSEVKPSSSDIKQKDQSNETDEEEEEIRLLKFEVLKKQNKDLLDRLKHFNENDYILDTRITQNVNSKQIIEQDVCDPGKKRTPDDIEYLYFYENSKERRKKLIRERHKAKFVARKQEELEMLQLEDECDFRTSRRCLDID